MDSVYDYLRQHSLHIPLDIRPGFTTTVGLVLLVAYLAVRRARQRYASIPAIGGSGLLQSYLNGIRFLSDPGTMIEEGYKKVRSSNNINVALFLNQNIEFGEEGIFRIPTPINWLVTLSPDRHLHETRGPNGHLLSASAARYDELYHFRYHVPIIRGPLVKNTEWLEEIRNEISVTCEEMMPVSSEWKSIPLLPATRTIITRSLYRIMLSEPDLSKRPEYIPILREEIESVVAKHGWTKQALSSMEKLESFMMETLRFNSPDLLNSPRKALTDYVLDNGIRIPKGSFVTVVETSRHRDETVYPNAKEFDGLRFYNKNKEASKEGNQPRQFTTISSDLIIFGVGPQACPGRFFATNVLKILLGYVLLTYDIKQDLNDPFVFGYKGLHWVPDPTKRLLFRERTTE
ncbi:hypothetical protein Clacol_008663 [Clathrus columnatus]|uniref:Cytochrome P450 n=1 Tax=Clathrus columnatus TaxID=1419009 RepID=A0AAV5AIF3_9AGAM|nr:hypothetical protein Clacol_008663 [Clathrus columnatus]